MLTIPLKHTLAQALMASSILNQQQRALLQRFCAEQKVPAHDFSLVYRGSRDGFGAADFHRLCDNKGPSITVVRSTGNFVFGGYTSVPWTSAGEYKRDAASFLFSLRNPTNSPAKLLVTHPEYAVYHHSGCGPWFGSGYDLRTFPFVCSFGFVGMWRGSCVPLTHIV